MQGTRAELPQRSLMKWSSVSFMLYKGVQGERGILLHHEAIPHYFRKNGRCRNAHLRLVPANDRAVRHIEPEFVPSINKQIRRLNDFLKGCKCKVHRALRRGQNSLAIDDLRLHHSNAVRTARLKIGKSTLSLRGSQHF